MKVGFHIGKRVLIKNTDDEFTVPGVLHASWTYIHSSSCPSCYKSEKFYCVKRLDNGRMFICHEDDLQLAE